MLEFLKSRFEIESSDLAIGVGVVGIVLGAGYLKIQEWERSDLSHQERIGNAQVATTNGLPEISEDIAEGISPDVLIAYPELTAATDFICIGNSVDDVTLADTDNADIISDRPDVNIYLVVARGDINMSEDFAEARMDANGNKMHYTRVCYGEVDLGDGKAAFVKPMYSPF